MADDLRRGFHDQLETAAQRLAHLAATVTELIPRATAILLQGDLEGADYLIRGDDEINVRSIELEERCYQIIALQAPVATDLRQVMSLVRMVAEIERSADLCANICKAARRICGPRPRPQAARDHQLDGRAGPAAVHRGDRRVRCRTTLAKAAAIDDMDSYLDGLQRQFVQAIFESHAAGRIDLQVAVQLAMVARFYERIGDHAVNIGERVQFIITGWLPEHKGADRYRQGIDDTGELPWSDDVTVFGRSRRAAELVQLERDRAGRDRDAAEAERHRLRTALDALGTGVVLADRNGVLQVRNEAATRVHRARGRAGQGGRRRAAARRVPRRRGDTHRRVRRPAAAGAARCRPQPLADGFALATIDDVSERARLDAVRTDFVANISHELKTPVGALAVLAEAAADSDDPEVDPPARPAGWSRRRTGRRARSTTCSSCRGSSSAARRCRSVVDVHGRGARRDRAGAARSAVQRGDRAVVIALRRPPRPRPSATAASWCRRWPT